VSRKAVISYNNSDRPLICAICGYSNKVEICHIKSVASFSKAASISEINNIDNLVALCPNHHWEFDKGLINI